MNPTATAHKQHQNQPYNSPRAYLPNVSAMRRTRLARSGVQHEFELSRKSNTYIKWVQSSLNKLLGLSLRVDGISGSRTKSAIRQFQQQAGLHTDGIVGSQTEQALVRSGADKPPTTNTTSNSKYDDLTHINPDEFRLVAVENPGGQRIKNKSAPRTEDVVSVQGYGRVFPLHKLAATAWKAMAAAARRDGLPEPLLRLTSGYRSPEHQQRLWDRALARYGSVQEARKWVAPPGGSAHQSGRTVDMYLGGKNSSSNVNNLRKTPAYKWLVINARRFGFYPYTREPWHWEYNPPANSGQPHTPVTPAHQPVSPSIPSITDAINYPVDRSKPYGARWKTRRPPGLPANVRKAGISGSALPYIDAIARDMLMNSAFITTVKHLATTESGARFALPANIFNALPPEQRGGKPLITAWGVFQFNRDAWRALPGVSSNAYPWHATVREELMKPLARYAQLFRQIKSTGGNDLSAARGLRLWHRSPAQFRIYSRRGRDRGYNYAWSRVPSRHSTSVDRRMRQTGLL